MFGRISKAIKTPTCVLIAVVGICAVGLALRSTRSQVDLLTSAKNAAALRADFDQNACLEQKFDRTIPAGAEVFNADENAGYSQRVLEYASARNIVVPRLTPRAWSVKAVMGSACLYVDIVVVPPAIKDTP